MGSFVFLAVTQAVIPRHSQIPHSLIPLLHFGSILMKPFTLFNINGVWVFRKQAEV